MPIESGIYKHFKGNLYFVEKLVWDINRGISMVVYYPLYKIEDKEAYCRELFDFKAIVPDDNNNPVERFILINEIPANKMQMFLIGSVVVDDKNSLYEIVGISLVGDEVKIFLCDYTYKSTGIDLSLTEFMEKYRIYNAE